MQTKDISDEAILAALANARGRNGAPTWSSLWDVQRALEDVPPKLVLSKLRSMLRRKLINGCGCGCRGDFELPDAHATDSASPSRS